MSDPREHLSNDQVSRYASQGTRAEITTGIVQELCGWREVVITLKDGRSATGVEASVPEAAAAAEQKALALPHKQ